MTLHPNPAERAAFACFDALMRAVAEPGLTRQLPDAGPAVIAQTLLDRETTAHADDPAVLAGTGTRLAPMERADYVFAPATAEVAGRLYTGDLLYPDAGATRDCAGRPWAAAYGCAVTGPGIGDAAQLCRSAASTPPSGAHGAPSSAILWGLT